MFTVVIGDERNSRIVIRKRINGVVLGSAYWPNILNPWKKTKFVFEVKQDGRINLFSEVDPYKPIITTFDPWPVDVEYLSFKNYLPEKTWFYYGNLPYEETQKETIKIELLKNVYETVSVNPLLQNWNQLVGKLEINCKYYYCN